jgi:hypothetical protein
VSKFLLSLLVSNTFLDLIVVGVIIEGAVLLAYRRITGRGLAPRAVFANLFSGGSLILALRISLETSVLAQGATAMVAACLAVALVAHVADLAWRWDRGAARATGPGTDA